MKAGKTILTLILLLVFFYPNKLMSQLLVDSTYTPQQLVDSFLVGNGVSASNITYSGANVSIGRFSTGSSATNLGLDEGILLTTGSIFNAPGPNSAPNKTTNTLGGSDPQLASLVTGFLVNDAAVLEFDFVPFSDTITIEYVFASEEYPEWVGSVYNDVFGFFVSGPNPAGGNYSNVNIALVPGTNLPVTVNNINNGQQNNGPCVHCNYYVNNTANSIEYDGFTTVMKSKLVVVPCTTYHLKIAIGDVGDHSYDSGIFLKYNSLSSNIVKNKVHYTNPLLTNYCVEGCSNALVAFTLDKPTSYDRTVHFSIGGTATNGVDYTHIPDSVVIPAGSDSVSLLINTLVDNLPEGTETVQLIVNTSSCSSDTLLININDYTAVSVNINSPPAVCVGDSALLSTTVLNGSVPFSYAWSTGDTLSSIKEKISGATTYSVTVTDYCGVSDSDTATVAVNSLPTVTATALTDTVCSGDTTSLFAGGASTFQWWPGASLSSTSGSHVIASPLTATIYNVEGTDTNGCKDTAQVSVNVISSPSVSASVSNPDICSGASTAITASGALSYQWSPSAGLNQTTGSSVSATPSNTVTYTVTGTSANGCTDTALAVVTVHPLPNLSVSPPNPSVCIGASKTLTASGAQTYSWNPSTYLNTTTGSTVISTPTATTSYVLTGTDNWGCVNTDTFTVTVHSLPNVTVSPFDTSICDNSSLVINAGGAFTYQWTPSSTLSSSTGASVTGSPNTTTTYTVVGTDVNGCKDTATAHIVVSPSPVLTPSNQTICAGDAATITASATLGGTTYLWNTGATGSAITVTPLSTSNYSVTATDTNGCTGSGQATVTVNPLPVLSISPATPAICIGNSVTISASGAASYTWSPATGLSATTGAVVVASPTTTTTYTLVGQSSSGCYDTLTFTVTVNPLPQVKIDHDDTLVCINSTFALTASGAANYSWSPSTYLSSTTGATVNVTPSTNISYVVTGTDNNGCVNSDTADISVTPILVVSSAPPRICVGDTAMVSASANSSPAFLWSNGSTSSSFLTNPNVTTTYSVTATDSLGCTAVDSVTVIVDTLPLVNVTPANSNICAGATVGLNASGATTYTWLPATGLSSTTGSSVNATPSSTTTYTVIGATSQGCIDSAHATINVIPSPTVSVSPATASFCIGSSTVLTASGALSYTWSPAAGLSTTTGASVNAAPTSTTVYKVVGTSGNGCKDSAYSNIVVNQLPVMTATPDSTDICIGTSASLSISGAASYSWSPSSSLSSSTGSQVTASPNATTTYKVIGTSSAGCVDSINVYVGVHPYPVMSLSPINPHMCPHDSVKIIAAGADTYIWSPATGLNTVSNDTVVAKPTQTTSYQVIGTSQYGCSDTLSTTVTVSPIPVITPGTAALCQNDSVKLTVSSNTSSSTFVWSTGATSDTIWVKPSVTTLYTVTATDASGCHNTDTALVTVNALPALAVNPPNPGICPGDSIEITATGAGTYQWLPASGLSAVTGDTIQAFPTSTTSYSLIGQTANGCNDTISFQVTVYALPTVSVTPPSAAICGGQTQMLVAAGASSYQWSPSTGLNVTNNDTVLATPANSLSYSVIGTDTNGCRDTAQAALTVYSNPIIVPVHPRICFGDSVVLSATGINPLSWLWSTGATTSSDTVAPANTTTYSVTATYPGGCVKSSSVNVVVYHDPEVVATASDYSVCPGDTALLSAVNCVSYQWAPASTLLQTTGDTVQALPSQSTLYTVTGTSVHFCQSTDTVQINLYPNPVITATATPSVICRNDSSLLSATGAVSYSWSPSAGLLSNGAAQVYASPDSTFQYTVTGVDTNGCVAWDTVTLHIDQGPSVYITPLHPVICQGDSVMLTAHGAVTYQWFPHLWLTSYSGASTFAHPLSNITYNLRAYDSLGCRSDTSVYVNVKRNPVVIVNPPLDSICAGDSIKICVSGAGGNGSYSWVPSTGLSSNTGDTIWASPTVNTTYHITGISTDGCSKAISSTIKVHPNPVISVSPVTQAICKNDSATINVTGANVYQWSPGSYIFSNNTNSIGVSPPVSMDYKVKGFNIHGCSDSTTAHITVHQLPNVFISAADTSICIGDSTSLTAGGASSYQWTPMASLVSSSGNSAKVIPQQTTSYSVKGTDGNGCENTDTFTVTVNPRPVISISPSATVVCQGSQVQLTGQSSMNPTVFVWNTGDTVNMLTDWPQTNTTYQVNGYNLYGCDDSATVTVQTNPYPQLSINVSDTIICDYDSIGLTATSNINPVNFLWSTSATSSSIVVNPTSTTVYSVTASDSIGCSDTIQALVRVEPTPAVTVSSSKNPSCAGDSIVIAANASGAVVSYLWNNSVVMPSMNIYPTVSGTYSVSVTDSVGCVNSDSIYQQVNPIPQMSISSSANQICYGDSVLLTASSSVNPVVFQWNTGSVSPSINATPFTTSTYTVSGTDSIGCSGSVSKVITVYSLPVITFSPSYEICNGDSINISASSVPQAVSYSWSTGATTPSVIVNPVSSTSYTVSITDVHGCENANSKNITVYPLPVVNVNPPYTGICSGDTITLSATANHPVQSVLWSTTATTPTISIAPQMTQIYWAEVTDTNSCSNSDTATVQVTTRPTCTITAVDDTICSADSTSIIYSGTASVNAQYNWNFDGGQHLQGSGKQPQWVMWNKGGYKIVSLTVTENGCTSYPDTAGVLVYLTPTVDFMAIPTEACESLLVNFQNKTLNVKDFYWQFGNPLDPNDTSTLENPGYAYPYAGSYTVGLFVNSNDGCPAYGSKTGYVNVHKNPVAAFGAYPNQTLISKPNVSFWDFSVGAKHWIYNFDDPKSGVNNTSTYDYPWHEFKDTGIFNVRLVVINEYGCTDTAWQKVHIKPFPQLYFPNAFSPNGDGLNDEFNVKGHDYNWNTFNIYIYNRWGQLVFHSSDINTGWNGKMLNTGEDCPNGNYVFVIKVEDKDKHKEQFRGNIMLLR